MENKCLICDKPLEIWDNTDSSNIQYRCADGHPPREGREDGERCEHWCGKPDCADGGKHYHHDKEQCTHPCGECFDVCPACPSHGAAKGEECELCKRGDHNLCVTGDGLGRCCHASPSEVGGEEWEKEFDREFTQSDPGGNSAGGMYPTEPVYEWAVGDPDEVKRFIRSLLSRSEKVGEARAWGKAVKAVPENRKAKIGRNGECLDSGNYPHSCLCAQFNATMVKMRERLIQAAKDDGHQVV